MIGKSWCVPSTRHNLSDALGHCRRLHQGGHHLPQHRIAARPGETGMLPLVGSSRDTILKLGVLPLDV